MSWWPIQLLAAALLTLTCGTVDASQQSEYDRLVQAEVIAQAKYDRLVEIKNHKRVLYDAALDRQSAAAMYEAALEEQQADIALKQTLSKPLDATKNHGAKLKAGWQAELAALPKDHPAVHRWNEALRNEALRKENEGLCADRSSSDICSRSSDHPVLGRASEPGVETFTRSETVRDYPAVHQDMPGEDSASDFLQRGAGGGSSTGVPWPAGVPWSAEGAVASAIGATDPPPRAPVGHRGQHHRIRIDYLTELEDFELASQTVEEFRAASLLITPSQLLVWGCFGGLKHCPEIITALSSLNAAEETQKDTLEKLEAAKAESDAKADLIENPPLSHQIWNGMIGTLPAWMGWDGAVGDLIKEEHRQLELAANARLQQEPMTALSRQKQRQKSTDTASPPKSISTLSLAKRLKAAPYRESAQGDAFCYSNRQTNREYKAIRDISECADAFAKLHTVNQTVKYVMRSHHPQGCFVAYGPADIPSVFMNQPGNGIADSGYGAATYLDSAILCKLIELPKGEKVRKRHPSDQHVIGDQKIIEILGQGSVLMDATVAAFLAQKKS